MTTLVLGVSLLNARREHVLDDCVVYASPRTLSRTRGLVLDHVVMTDAFSDLPIGALDECHHDVKRRSTYRDKTFHLTWQNRIRSIYGSV